MSFGLAPSRRSGEEEDTYSSSFGGKKAFFDLASTLFPAVSRSTENLIPHEGVDTLVVLGPTRYPSQVQWLMLRDWVSEGHALIFAARWQDPEVDLGPFGIQVEAFYGYDAEAEEAEASEGGRDEGQAEEEAEPPPLPPGADEVETDLAGGELEWASFAGIAGDYSPEEIMVSLGGSPQVVWQSVGEGFLVVASSDYIFNNVSLTQGNNGVLAFRILELGYPAETIYFDESLNSAGGPKVVGLLFDDPFRPLTLQLLVFAVLFAWRGSRRFGPSRAERKTVHRSLTEHAAALGNLHFKAGSAGGVVASYLEYFRHELSLQYRKAEEAQTLAARTGSEVDQVSHLMKNAAQAVKNPNLPRSKAAWLVRSLASLKAKAEHWKGASHGA
jgi:hypothetical protein